MLGNEVNIITLSINLCNSSNLSITKSLTLCTNLYPMNEQ